MDLSTILSAIQNLNTQLSAWVSSAKRAQGNLSSGPLSATTVICTGSGRLCAVSVTTAGGAAGSIYDGSSTTVSGDPIYTVGNTVGFIVVGLEFTTGLVYVPGSSQKATIGYYRGP